MQRDLRLEAFKEEQASAYEKYQRMKQRFQRYQSSNVHFFMLEKLNPMITYKPIKMEQFGVKSNLNAIMYSLCIDKLHYLCEIQYEYDLFKKKFVSLNYTEQPVKDVLNNIFQKQFKDITELYNDICSIFQYQQGKIDVSLLYPIFNCVYSVFLHYPLVFDEETLMKLLFSGKITLPYGSLNEYIEKSRAYLKMQIDKKCIQTEQQKKDVVTAVFNAIGPNILARHQVHHRGNNFFGNINVYADQIHDQISVTFDQQQQYIRKRLNHPLKQNLQMQVQRPNTSNS